MDIKCNSSTEIEFTPNPSLEAQNACDEKSEPLTPGVPKSDMLYEINDVPPWYMSLFLGLQHYLTMFGGTVSIPLILTPAMCFADDHVSKSEVIGTIFFVSGIVTLLQSIVGVRLPIIQGGTFAFLAPTFAILSLPKWKCPEIDVHSNETSVDQREIWEPRMREVQGAIIVSSLFQIVIGCSGVIGFILRFIGPLTIAATISLVGLALFETGANISGEHWWIAIMTIFLITLFSQYLRDVDVPILKYSKKHRTWSVSKYPLFKVFPVMLAIAVSWLVCYILTQSGVFPEQEGQWGWHARTDTKLHVLTEAKWFRIPYPGQWGLPTVSVAAVFGMLSGVLASMIESLGDYYAAARLANAPPPPVHAINRGIFVEGLGCVIAGLWGTGNGTTSYSENIGAIGITKVGSRRVVQMAALLMIFFGVFGKFGAIFVTIPHPIIGGIFMVMFGTVFAVGVSNLQFVDLNSGRNLFIYGFSVIAGLGLPKWLDEHPGAINTGSQTVDQIFTVLCSTGMFVAGFLATLMDNTVPGTLKERGMLTWQQHHIQPDSDQSDELARTYDFPFGMEFIRRHMFFEKIPLCPTFNVFFTKKIGTSSHDRGEKCEVEIVGKDTSL